MEPISRIWAYLSEIVIFSSCLLVDSEKGISYQRSDPSRTNPSSDSWFDFDWDNLYKGGNQDVIMLVRGVPGNPFHLLKIDGYTPFYLTRKLQLNSQPALAHFVVI